RVGATAGLDCAIPDEKKPKARRGNGFVLAELRIIHDWTLVIGSPCRADRKGGEKASEDDTT
ncbi:MAG TPA: hypothetical protein VHM90_04055, partial [Phycisphaerae bacterium]|nr:hypothetical protein [Phycisphaerae bacterium]